MFTREKREEGENRPRRRRPPRWFCEHWNFEEGTNCEVIAYTNSPEAELFLNGKSLGRKKADNEEHGNMIVWELPFEKGELKAVIEGCEYTLKTTSEPVSISLSVSPFQSPCTKAAVGSADGGAVHQISNSPQLLPDSCSTLRVDVSLLDENGNKVNWDDRVITAQVSGLSATLAGIESGSGFDVTPYSSPSRKLHNGNGVIYLKSTDIAGESTLTVTSPGLPPVSLTIKS